MHILLGPPRKMPQQAGIGSGGGGLAVAVETGRRRRDSKEGNPKKSERTLAANESLAAHIARLGALSASFNDRGFLAVLLGLIKIREARGADVVKMMGNDYDADDYTMHVLGELMYQSHGSYSGLGLGNFGTDALVNAVRAVKRGAGDDRATALFGAKITGGGCGGTVCVLGRKKPGRDSEYAHKDALDAVEGIRTEYAAKIQGKIPTLFLGSSPGAVAYGHLKLGFKE